MFIAANEKLNLLELLFNKGLQDTTTLRKFSKPKLEQQLSRHSIGETLANEKYPWQKLALLPYGKYLSNNLARNKLPGQIFLRYLCILSIRTEEIISIETHRNNGILFYENKPVIEKSLIVKNIIFEFKFKDYNYDLLNGGPCVPKKVPVIANKYKYKVLYLENLRKKKTCLMFITVNEKLKLIGQLSNKGLQELLTKPIEIKSIFMRFTQTSGSSLDKLKSVKVNLNQSPHDYPTEILENYPHPRLVQLPSGNSLEKLWPIQNIHYQTYYNYLPEIL
ncbi:hypothetical protein H8356DRAFT_1359084 [Neocallimastix lanati (nom. inval.)]|nr:hypothetical protein H8356DRAFT_1359084 [Neocallimastix sp. JGI-2020a]